MDYNRLINVCRRDEWANGVGVGPLTSWSREVTQAWWIWRQRRTESSTETSSSPEIYKQSDDSCYEEIVCTSPAFPIRRPRIPSPIAMSSQQKALWLTSKQGVFEVGPKNIPKPGPGELLVKIFAAALNPVDWKVQAHGFLHVQIYPAVLGSDASGTVEAVGEGVSGFTKGDRV